MAQSTTAAMRNPDEGTGYVRRGTMGLGGEPATMSWMRWNANRGGGCRQEKPDPRRTEESGQDVGNTAGTGSDERDDFKRRPISAAESSHLRKLLADSA